MENKLTPEQIENLKACKTAEEAKALAEKEGVKLSEEELEQVVGGVTTFNPEFETASLRQFQAAAGIKR